LRAAGGHPREPLDAPAGSLTHAFPTPDTLAAAALDGVGLPRARRETLRELAHRLASGTLRLDPGADRNEVQRRLLEIPGVGTWTATYISLRALGDPDAFPAGDRRLRRAARTLGLPGSAAALAARSRRWRPWRAYAAHHLWAADG
jgi:AraC family transcriptional regulator, regulatory protein of adaptative response / DNA-3-methyladenine glycosylase II